jgi:pimeloyl-ACP methyl ester carboxylesterase
VYFLHVMGNLDDHDHDHNLTLTDEFARDGEVVLFNNPGLTSTGLHPDTTEAAAHDAASFLDAVGPTIIELLDDSVSGPIAQHGALDRLGLVRRLIFVGGGPRGGHRIGNLSPRPQPCNPRFRAPDSGNGNGGGGRHRQPKRPTGQSPTPACVSGGTEATTLRRWATML